MSAKDELERLNKLGAEAAHRARVTNSAANYSNTMGRMGAAMMRADRTPMPVVGRLSVTIAMFLVFRLVLSYWQVPYDAFAALIAVIVIEAGLWSFKRRRAAKLRNKALSLQAHLHDLKQQEFALRYEEAKRNGKLKQFEETEQT